MALNMTLNNKKKWTGYVSREELPLRKKPDDKSGIIMSLGKGVKVDVCDTRSGWLYVDVNGTFGYVSARYIKYSEAKRPTPSSVVRWIGKTTQAVRGRDWASRYGTGAVIKKGTAVKVCDTLNGFYYVQVVGGGHCFVDQAYVRYVSEPGKDKAEEFLAAVKNVQEHARKNGYRYGDSRTAVPTADKLISCDRLVAKALYDLGYTDQVRGGIALGRGFEDYLTAHGFTRSTSLSAAKAGSVIVCVNPSGSSRHVFVIAAKKGDSYTRYDCGCDEWIKAKQPLAGLWMSRLIAVYNIKN